MGVMPAGKVHTLVNVTLLGSAWLLHLTFRTPAVPLNEALLFSVGSAPGARPTTGLGFSASISTGKSNSSAPKMESFGTDPDAGGCGA